MLRPRVAAPCSGTRLELAGLPLQASLVRCACFCVPKYYGSCICYLPSPASGLLTAVVPHSQDTQRAGPISKFNLQRLYFPGFGPHIAQLPRDSSPPLLRVGSQVEPATIS